MVQNNGENQNSACYEEVKSLLKSDLTLLAWCRLQLDNPTDMVNIEQDVNDLFHFPERIEGSYRKEWLTYCLPIIKRAIPQQFNSIDGFQHWLSTREPSHIDAQQLFHIIIEIEKSREKIVPFPSPLRTYIDNLIKCKP